MKSKIPLLGICYGAQLSTVAFARNVMSWKGAHTTEVDIDSLYPVVDLMDEQKTTVIRVVRCVLVVMMST